MASAIASPPATRLALRARVALLCALLGLVVSSCLALVAVHFSDSYVDRLVGEMLRVEADYLRARHAVDATPLRPRSKHFSTFAGADAPAELRALAPGIHDVTDAHGERHVAVYEAGGERFYVVLDIGLESVRERRLMRDLLALILFGSALASWLGWFLAGRAIEPVRRLAQRVETLEPPGPAAASMAQEFADDEVGALARAFDRYQERLRDYVRRERAFTADASHELRTPLAVIRGALEVLLDQGADAATVARLKRIQRGSDELRDLLDALLVLARGDEQESVGAQTADLDALVDGLLRERQDALRQKRLQIERERRDGVTVGASPKVLGVVIGNLLRSVTEFADGGVLTVSVTASQLKLAHRTVAAEDAAVPPARVESGNVALGLGMIRRVCERRGWALEESAGDEGDRAFVLRFA